MMKKITLLLTFLPFFLCAQTIDLRNGTPSNSGTFGFYNCLGNIGGYQYEFYNELLEYNFQVNDAGFININGSIEWINGLDFFNVPPNAGVICPILGADLGSLNEITILLKDEDDNIIEEVLMSYSDIYGTGTIEYEKFVREEGAYKVQIFIHSRINASVPTGTDGSLPWYGMFNIQGELKYEEQEPFITTWQTDLSTEDPTSITLVANPNYAYNYDVDWENDGVYDDIGITSTITHDYNQAGTYTVAIRGRFPHFKTVFNEIGSFENSKKIISVDQWGDIRWETMNGSFAQSFNLTISASDVPDLDNVNSIDFIFQNINAITSNLNLWDVSNVTLMRNVFNGISGFNQDISAWNVSNVTNMQAMFSNTPFNQDISSWDVSNVTDMRSMFLGNTSFNQDISSWDVSNVTNMNRMFLDSVFNSDISNWNTSNVTDMDLMFYAATAFNQDISSWDVSNVTNMQGMFTFVTLSTNNYNALLEGWSQQLLQPNVTFSAGYSEYCTSAKQDIIDNFGWTITDGGAEAGCAQTNQDYAALEAFYNATNGPTWTNNTNWLSDEPLNAWAGVTLDTNGRVSRLNLGGFGLSGTLPPEIGDLDALESLGLAFNNISGTIPTELGNLSNLKGLVLSANPFTGTIPSSIGNLSSLESIQIAQTNMSGPIPQKIGNLSNLVNLGLFTNNFTGPLPAEFGNLTSLQYLSLIDNDINGVIPSSLGNLPNISSISLDDNNLSGNIPSSIFNIASLAGFSIRNNNLSGELPPNVGNAQNLYGLFLSDNNLEGTIPPSMGDLPNLVRFEIDNNNFSGPIPDLSQTAVASNPNSFVAIQLNDFIFSDLEPQFDYLQNNVNTFTYAPMNPFTEPETISIVLGQDITLDTTFNNGTSGRLANAALNVYQWYKDDVLINGATDSSYTILSATNADAGTYICSVTNTDVPGLTLETSPYVVEASLGIVDLDGQSFKLYPNPTKDKLTIASSNNIPIDTVEFYDILGKRILTISRNFESIDVSKLALGTYFVKIKAGSSSVSKKLVVN
jgi:surface protein